MPTAPSAAAPPSALPSAPPGSIESRDPATGRVWRRFDPVSADAVAAAVAAARAAQPAWAARPLDERLQVVARFHRLLFARRAEVAELLVREAGKPWADAMASEVLITLDQARFYLDEAPRVLRPTTVRPRSLAMLRKQVHVTHEAWGVVGVIAPWNYPFMLAAGHTLPALLAGNAVVLKPSELTPHSGVLLGELLHAAGVPAAVLHVLPGDGATGAALSAGDVDKVFFTGSVATGRRVAEACARRLVPCVLELGGSDPAVVLDDADVAHAAAGIAWGRFSNAGQTCVAPKRVYVTAPAYEPFVAALAGVVAGLRVGPGEAAESDLGPLIRPSQAAALRAQLDDALAGGARVVAEGALTAAAAAGAAADPEGSGFFPPTVLADVRPDARVLREETFGPLLPVVRVRDADEAVRLANASVFGLSASVWTRDAAVGRRVADRLQAGTVVINDSVIVAGMAEVPHGGVKESGMGRSHGTAGLLECVRTKTVVTDRLAGVAQPWWFRGAPGARAAAIEGFARLAHGHGARERLGGLAGTIRLLRGR